MVFQLLNLEGTGLADLDLYHFVERPLPVDPTRDLFCIDGERLTCAGGTAVLDLMLALIAEQHGQDTAAEVVEQLLHTRIREPGESQRMAVQWRYHVADRGL
jgi:transcriptional regulator GlxA family with amidase domain